MSSERKSEKGVKKRVGDIYTGEKKMRMREIENMGKDRHYGFVQTGSLNQIFGISRLESDCFSQVWRARNT